MIKVNDGNIKEIVRQRIKETPYADLNDLDVSEVTDMSFLFYKTNFKGDISRWDTSHVFFMTYMFSLCDFNGNIGGWDVSNVISADNMFSFSLFDKDIGSWRFKKDCSCYNMFYKSAYTHIFPKGIDPKIALGDDYYNYAFKQKLETIIKTI